MDRFDYYEVRLVQNEGGEPSWVVVGDNVYIKCISRNKAFNYLGIELGAKLKMQTKAGVFIFQRRIKGTVNND